jgi:hypothetical protein
MVELTTGSGWGIVDRKGGAAASGSGSSTDWRTFSNRLVSADKKPGKRAKMTRVTQLTLTRPCRTERRSQHSFAGGTADCSAPLSLRTKKFQ